MVGIQCHSCFSQLCDDQRNVPLRSLHFDCQPQLRLNTAQVELLPINGLHVFFHALTVSLISGDDDVFGFADLHSQ